MKRQPSDNDHWKPCPPGELKRLVGRIKTQRRIRLVNWALVASLAVVLCVWAGVYFSTLPHSGEYNFAGITCSEVHELGPRYMAGTLPQDRLEQIGRHIAQCPDCGPFLERMQRSMSSATASWRSTDPQPVALPIAQAEAPIHGRQRLLAGN